MIKDVLVPLVAAVIAAGLALAGAYAQARGAHAQAAAAESASANEQLQWMRESVDNAYAMFLALTLDLQRCFGPGHFPIVRGPIYPGRNLPVVRQFRLWRRSLVIRRWLADVDRYLSQLQHVYVVIEMRAPERVLGAAKQAMEDLWGIRNSNDLLLALHSDGVRRERSWVPATSRQRIGDARARFVAALRSEGIDGTPPVRI